MSILDQIRTAEDKAGQQKQDALADSREFLRKTEAAAVQQADTVLETARKNADAVRAKAQKTAEKQMQDLLEQQAQKDKNTSFAAQANMAKAVHYIVERVEKY